MVYSRGMKPDSSVPEPWETTEPLPIAYELEPGDRVDGYEIDEPLKAGGWGQVFVAHRTSNDRRVALKTIKPEHAGNPGYRRRFREEQEAFAELERHPNLCPASDWNKRSRGLLWLVMPWIDGQNLFEVVGSSPMPPERAAELIAQAADGLHEVHVKTGRAHRDVHPGNLMVEDGDRLLVIDFGLAKRFNHPSGSPAERRTSIWTSPEGSRGDEMTAQADVYSLGLVLAYALTGLPPVDGKPQFTPNRPVPSRLREAIAEATAEDLQERTPSAAAMASKLREYLQEAQTPPPPPRPGRERPAEAAVPPRSGAGKAVPIGAALAIAALAGLLGFGLTASLVPSGAQSSTGARVRAAGVSFTAPSAWRPAAVSPADRELGMEAAVTGPDATVLVGSVSRQRIPAGTAGNMPIEVAVPAGRGLRADDVPGFEADRMFVFHTAQGYPAIVCRGTYGARAATVEEACGRVVTGLRLDLPALPIPFPAAAVRRQASHALGAYAKARREAGAAIEAAASHAEVRTAAAAVAEAAEKAASWVRDRRLASLRTSLEAAAQAWRAAAAAAHDGSGFQRAGEEVKDAEGQVAKARLRLLSLGYRR